MAGQKRTRQSRRATKGSSREQCRCGGRWDSQMPIKAAAMSKEYTTACPCGDIRCSVSFVRGSHRPIRSLSIIAQTVGKRNRKRRRFWRR
jgi:hypothetical protein